MDSATGLSLNPDLAAALHRLRSTLARLKAELELAQDEGATLQVRRLLGDLEEALDLLRDVERIALGLITVLVIDDDARLGELMARGLRRLGFDSDSTDAFRESHRGEVVVFDLGLYTGLDEVARSLLRAAKPIVVTGATDPGSRALATSLNASDYLVKPIEMEDLAAAINRRTAEGSP